MVISDEIICCSCTIQELLNEFNIEIEDLEENPKIKVVGYGEEKVFICKECESELEPLNMYFECEDDYNNAVEMIAIFIASRISEAIEYCSHCEGQHLEYVEYVAAKEEIPIKSRGIDFYNFLFDNNLQEEFHGKVIPYLRCSNCGYGEAYHPNHNPDGGHFDYSDKVYSTDDVDEFWGFEEELINIAQIYNIKISSDLIDDFIEHCSNNPMLAANHELASIIFEVLQKVLNDGQRVLKLKPSALLYRGRCRAKDASKYKVENLGMPPLGIASHGRYNLVGTSVLYLSDDRIGIPYEVEPKKNEVVDIATYQVKHALALFNVDEIFKEFSMYISRENEESKTVKRNYLFTNFLASACNEVGFDGMYYKGAGEKAYNNIALFEKAISKVQSRSEVETVEFIKSYQFKVKSTNSL